MSLPVLSGPVVVEEDPLDLMDEIDALKKEKDPASRERLEKLERELADVTEQSSTLRAQWLKEKEEIGKSQKVAEKIEQLRSAGVRSA